MDVPSEGPERIDLALRPNFRLGQLLVEPSACRVVIGSEQRAIQRRVMEVLVVLAETANQTVARDELIRRCWGQKVVGDDAVNRIIAKVRDIARGLEPAPFVLETIPRIGFRLNTRDDAAAAAPAPPPGPSAPRARAAPWTARSAAAAVVLALVIVAASAGLWRFTTSQSARHAPESADRVEVAPFDSLGADRDLRRISLDISDSLVRILDGVGVDAIPRLPLRQGGAAADLRIAGLIERENGAYVVKPRIEDVASGRMLWSGRLMRQNGPPGGVAEQVANQISDILNCGLQRRAASHSDLTPAVFGLLLSYCEARDGDAATMLEAARRLVATAPRLSIAHSMLAAGAAWTATESLSEADARALQDTARAEAARALRLDPKNGEAFFALAVALGYGADWVERERDLQRANQLAPGQVATLNVQVLLLREVGRLNEAMDLDKTIIAANPFRWTQLWQTAQMTAARGDVSQVQPLVDRLELIRPAAARELRWIIAFWWGEPLAARVAVRQLAPAEDVACLEPYLDRLVKAKSAVVRGLPAACETFEVDWRIRMLAREGDLDGAYALLGSRVPPEQRTTIFLFYPEMKAFREDPRFMIYARRVGLLNYWERSGHWPDFCEEPDLPYACRKAGPVPTRQ